MKANELMIGDWVQYTQNYYTEKKGTWSEVHYGRVCSVGLLYVKVDSGSVAIEPEIVKPIPLTAEILEKNGWKHEFDKTEYMVKYELAQKGKNCWMMWAIKEHNLDIQRQDEKLNMYNLKVQKVCIPCDYVHELQHAVRLCGIKREIEL